MDVIRKFHHENILQWKCLSKSCLFCLVFVFVWIECLLGENFFDSETLGIDLACNSRVVVYPTAVPVSIFSKWEKSQLWIEPSRKGIPTTELNLCLLPRGSTSRQGATKPDLWEGETHAVEYDLWAGEIPPRRTSVPVRRLRKAHMPIYVNTFTQGHIPSRSA